ncbi:MAG: hypothetical protein CR966_00295 [Pseudomonadales bacterium]|nr:MAG: hypothetical protein CR966_00295 [Pseudomonadales bacterium]
MKTLAEAQATLKDDDYSMDEDIQEIFIEEAVEVLQEMDENLPKWNENPTDFAPLKEIRRGFHTLKGSGRMVGANNVGEVAWAVENLLNRVLDNNVEISDEIVEFVSEAKSLIPHLVNDFASQQAPSVDPAILILMAENLRTGRVATAGLDEEFDDASEQETQSVTETAPVTEEVSEQEVADTETTDTETTDTEATETYTTAPATSTTEQETVDKGTDTETEELSNTLLINDYFDDYDSITDGINSADTSTADSDTVSDTVETAFADNMKKNVENTDEYSDYRPTSDEPYSQDSSTQTYQDEQDKSNRSGIENNPTVTANGSSNTSTKHVSSSAIQSAKQLANSYSNNPNATMIRKFAFVGIAVLIFIVLAVLIF